MSNYLFVFAAERAAPGIQGWLRKYDDGNSWDVVHTQASESVSLFVVSYDLPRSLDRASSTFFKGSAVDHEDGSVIFGLQGWLDYQETLTGSTYRNLEGQFLHVDWSGRSARFQRDVFGMLPLLYTRGSGYVAVSDSMLALADLRQHMGDLITPNEEVLLARSVFSVLGGQQLSPETIVEQIQFVPARQSLDVAIVADPRATTSGRALDGLQLQEDETYRDGIRTGATNVARLMATLSKLKPWSPVVSLSGGYDSRLCLAGAVASGVEKDLVYNTKNSLPVHAADFEVASLLADRWQFSLSKPTTGNPLRRERKVDCSPFLLWAMSDLGIYDYVTRSLSSREPYRWMGVTGLGGEVLRGNYGWKSWTDAVAGINAEPLISSALVTQGRKGLEAVGVDPDARTASELHYLNYRHALHAGQHLPLHMLGFAPLLQSNLTALAYSRVNEFPMPAYEGVGMVNDMTIVLHPEMAGMPYDTPAKSLSEDFIQDRLLRLGGPIDASHLAEYVIHGSPDDVAAGPPKFLISLAEKRGLDLPQTAETFLDLGAKGLEILSGEPLRSIYSAVNDNARWRLIAKNMPPIGAGETPGKLVAVQALFGT